ncbi:CsbD family protein [Acidisoma sp.]|uniref:CsbD family protein n=1 Tax=Acidisoma sp. TaxID=1872115 RepID=UPI003B0094D1
MDKDRVKGAGKKVAGSVKEAAGDATADKELKAKGKAEKTAGEVQHAAGKTKDAVRDSVKK